MRLKLSKLVLVLASLSLGACKLSVNVEGEGGVVSSDALIQCGEECSAQYADNQTIELTQQAQEGYYFSKWLGCNRVDNDVCIADVGPWISKSITAVFKPDFVGRIYQYDFESPLHQVGVEPTWGPGPNLLPTYFPYRGPLITDAYPQLSGQAMLFGRDPDDNSNKGIVRLPVGYGADKYRIAMDLVLSDPVNAEGYSRIMFGPMGGGTLYEFGIIHHWASQEVEDYQVGTPVHFEALLDIQAKLVTYRLNGEFERGPYVLKTSPQNDLGSLWIEHSQDGGLVVIDNLRVEGVWSRDFQLDEVETEQGEYILDLDQPPITAASGVVIGSFIPYKENGFNLNLMHRIDPSINGTGISNGTVHAFPGSGDQGSFLYHENGYRFRLHSIDLAIMLDREVIFKGYTHSGEVLEHVVPGDGQANIFRTEEFGEEWTDLTALWIGRLNKFRYDNIKVSITSEETILSD